MMLCLWMFASATHFHLPAEDASEQHTTKEFCGFCASLPATGAAPSLAAFVLTADGQYVLAPAEILLSDLTLTTASYRSRAPPAI